MIIHYADLLKFILKQYFHWNGQKDEYGRHLLQYIGTDVIRDKDPDYWARFVKDVVSIVENEYDYAVIPDCRFENEYAIMHDAYPSVLVRVVAPIENTDADFRCHISETAMDNVKADVDIINTKESLGQLLGAIPALASQIEDKFNSMR